MFAGEGGFGTEVSKSCAMDSDFVDNAIDPRHNLRSKRQVGSLCRSIAMGLYFLVHLAPPCSTWSRARLPRLRLPGKWIEGLPNLKASQRLKIAEGNDLAWATICLIRAALAAGIGLSPHVTQIEHVLAALPRIV